MRLYSDIKISFKTSEWKTTVCKLKTVFGMYEMYDQNTSLDQNQYVKNRYSLQRYMRVQHIRLIKLTSAAAVLMACPESDNRKLFKYVRLGIATPFVAACYNVAQYPQTM